MEFSLDGKRALITGGSRGIGKATALRLAASGADIAICGRTRESLDETAHEVVALGRRCWTYQTDVSETDAIEKMMLALNDDTGGIDILVNNAVTSTSAPFDELTDLEFRYHIDVKLMAYIRIARQALPMMIERGGGRIVNVGGMTARIVAPLRMTNGVVNAGVANFTKQFSGYCARHKVTVNCVHPGYTVTERMLQIFTKEASEEGISIDDVVANRTADVPLGRLIAPDDLAAAVLFFCSPMATMITGQSIAVDGGSGESIPY